MAGEGENSVNRDYTFTVQITDVPREYMEKVKEALKLIKVVACSEIAEQTYDAVNRRILSNAQLEAVKEFDKFLDNHTHYLTREDLEEFDITPEIGAEFETDRIDFVTHRYVITRHEAPYWIAKCIA